MRATLERHAQAQLVQGPWALAQWAQMPPMSALHTPQMATPLHQPPPGWPATHSSRQYSQVYWEGIHF